MESNRCNHVTLIGELGNIEICKRNKTLCHATMKVARRNGSYDIIPVSLPVFLVEGEKPGGIVEINGAVGSRQNRYSYDVWIMAREILHFGTDDSVNYVKLTGIVKIITNKRIVVINQRKRKVRTIIISVPRTNGKETVIPCIIWDTNADYADLLSDGEEITIFGKIQSRIYHKKNAENVQYGRMVYEISANKILTSSILEGDANEN